MLYVNNVFSSQVANVIPEPGEPVSSAALFEAYTVCFFLFISTKTFDCMAYSCLKGKPGEKGEKGDQGKPGETVRLYLSFLFALFNL